MSNKSLIDYAYEVLSASKEPINYRELFDKAVALSKQELSPEDVRHKMSSLYTQLSLDGRFIVLSDGNWDLRTRHVYSQAHLDILDVDDDEGEEYDPEEAELLSEELGEAEEKEDVESDDLDFDRVKSGSDAEEGF